jgi:large subunit ribosomal protein L6
MSRIGVQKITLPENVKVEIAGSTIKVVGPRGELEKKLPRKLGLEINEEGVSVLRKANDKETRSLHGTFRSHISNMVKGVSEGWSKTLELVGTGYRAELQGNKLVLSVGYSHPIEIEAEKGIGFRVEKTSIFIEGVDKERVGHVAAKIRAVRPPEPYKGKGIKYINEVVKRKAGKAAKAQGGA